MKDQQPRRSNTFSSTVLVEWSRQLLVKTGATEVAADATARALLDAQQRGVDTHGFVMLRLFLPMIRNGAIAGAGSPIIVADGPGSAVIDARNGLGPYAAEFAVELACEKAASTGAAATVVRRSSHFGAASVYSEMAARKGCVCIAASNSDPGMAPLGALGPVLGTNPLAIAAPGAGESALLSLDIATSVVALGRVRAAARKGETLPEGWAMGVDGNPTRDAAAALQGSLLPASGHKGFGLALMIDVLAGCLSGSATSPWVSAHPDGQNHPNVGHFFVALYVPAFAESGVFDQSLQELVGAVHSAPRREGIPEFQVPGEREHAIARDRRGGIPLTDEDQELLERLGFEFGLPFPSWA